MPNSESRFRWLATAVCGMGAALAGPGVVVRAGAVATDGTVGAARPLVGPTFKVTKDLGRQVGGNLFHSFRQLDLSAGEEAEFSGPASVTRVFARVTGDAPSSIDGTLRCTIPAADFYLMNPAGVVFGPNAVLDVRGSFAVTTADSLKLSDGGRMDARMPADSVLTSAPPAAFGFLGTAAGSVRISGSRLMVGPLRSIAVVGSQLTVAGAGTVIAAPAGRIMLATARPGSAVDATTGDAAALPAPRGDAGRVTVSDGARLDVDGRSGDPAAAAAGTVRIIAGTVEFRDGAISGRPAGSADGGVVELIGATAVRLSGRADPLVPTVSTTSTSGGGGRVDITAPEVRVLDGAAVSAGTTAGGVGGSIRLAGQDVLIDAGHTPATASTAATPFTGLGVQSAGGAGNGGPATPRSGSITVVAERLAVRRGGQVSTAAFGNGGGGDIKLSAASVEVDGNGLATGISADTSAGSSGTGGRVSISAGRVLVANAGVISTVTRGTGAGGPVSVVADDLALDGGNLLAFTGIQSDTTATSAPAGAGGSISVQARALRVFGTAGIRSNTFGVGSGGRVEVRADVVTVEGQIPGLTGERGSAIIAESRMPGPGAGAGGNVDVRARTVRVADGGIISSRSDGFGAAGGVRVEARGRATVSGGSIAVSSARATAGGLAVAAGESLSVRAGGSLTAQSAGAGGNLRLASDGLIALSGGTATAAAAGDGGRVSIASRVLALADSTIDARSGGRPVEVRITSEAFLSSNSQILTNRPFELPTTDIAGSLVPLRATVEVSARLAEQCEARLAASPASSFLSVGRGGAAADPGAGVVESVFDAASWVFPRRAGGTQ
jgi:filamentous hemagglutinin family protein